MSLTGRSISKREHNNVVQPFAWLVNVNHSIYRVLTNAQ